MIRFVIDLPSVAAVVRVSSKTDIKERWRRDSSEGLNRPSVGGEVGRTGGANYPGADGESNFEGKNIKCVWDSGLCVLSAGFSMSYWMRWVAMDNPLRRPAADNASVMVPLSEV